MRGMAGLFENADGVRQTPQEGMYVLHTEEIDDLISRGIPEDRIALPFLPETAG